VVKLVIVILSARSSRLSIKASLLVSTRGSFSSPEALVIALSILVLRIWTSSGVGVSRGHGLDEFFEVVSAEFASLHLSLFSLVDELKFIFGPVFCE
jgi:hypothetical protein